MTEFVHDYSFITKPRSDWDRVYTRVKLAFVTRRSIAEQVSDTIKWVHKYPDISDLDSKLTVY